MSGASGNAPLTNSLSNPFLVVKDPCPQAQVGQGDIVMKKEEQGLRVISATLKVVPRPDQSLIDQAALAEQYEELQRLRQEVARAQQRSLN